MQRDNDSKTTKDLIEAKSGRSKIGPSSDINPIENAFYLLKRGMKSLGLRGLP